MKTKNLVARKSRAYRVYLEGKCVDTVFATYPEKNKAEREDEMHRSLIGHDGYDHRIIVKEQAL